MSISIIGLGWFGLPLADRLLKLGYEIKGSAQTVKYLPGVKFFTLSYPALPAQELMDCDVLILNIPPFEAQLNWFQNWKWQKKTWIVFISSTSQRPILLNQEKWIAENFSNWSILRFGGLYGGDRHPGKHLSGKKNLPGRLWPVNLLHLEDALGFTQTVIEKKLQNEVFEVVGNEHPTREEFYTRYCNRMGIPLPHFDEKDNTKKEAVSNDRARTYYQFKY